MALLLILGLDVQGWQMLIEARPEELGRVLSESSGVYDFISE